jgi:pyruvate ferredoxin oxidoreductase delta subunit
MKEKGWKELTLGGVIDDPGNAARYNTGSWRTYAPIWSEEKCIHCFACWIYCPDNSIKAKDGKITGIEYFHCKGCGICAAECPEKANAIDMVLEAECELPE